MNAARTLPLKGKEFSLIHGRGLDRLYFHTFSVKMETHPDILEPLGRRLDLVITILTTHSQVWTEALFLLHALSKFEMLFKM